MLAARHYCRLLQDAVPELVAFQRALRDCVLSIDATYGKEVEELHVGLEGSFGSKHVTPRSLSAAHLGSMVCVEGIVTKCKYACTCDVRTYVCMQMLL